MTTRREMSRHHRAGLPAGTPLRRPSLRWWRELALVLVGYWLYTGVRNAVPDQRSAAELHADQIYRFERWLSIDIELAINQAIDRISWLIVGMNYYYAVAHFVLTIGVFVWLYRGHPHHYRRARTVFLVTNASALAVFYLYPLAPPRLLPELGYIDTVVTHGTWGSWASGDVAAATNQYAAMPSMHVAWSLWCAIAIFLLARRRWVRVLGLAHPLATLAVIVATGNHFVLDAAGGIAALAVGYALPVLVIALYQRYGDRLPYRRARVPEGAAVAPAQPSKSTPSQSDSPSRTDSPSRAGSPSPVGSQASQVGSQSSQAGPPDAEPVLDPLVSGQR